MQKLRKFLEIRNLGLFANYTHSGRAYLKEVTLIYGENGVGKSTLGSILRSLKGNSYRPLLRRKRVIGEEDPKVRILQEDNNSLVFEGKEWDEGLRDIMIFDEEFVNKNVCSGRSVELDHQKNLYGFVIGEKGVELKKELLETEELIETLGRDIGEVKEELKESIKGNYDIDSFLELSKADNIENSIAEKEKEIERLKRAKEIEQSDKLPKIELPDFDKNLFKEMLEKDLESISKKATTVTKKHINENLNQDGEEWLNKGLDYAETEICPFCGEPTLKDNALIEYFKRYFDKSYQEHVEELKSYKQKVRQKLADDKIVELTQKIDQYQKLINFWKEHLTSKLDYPQYDKNIVKKRIKDLRQEFVCLTSVKINDPLGEIKIDRDFEEILGKYKSLEEELAEKRKKVSEINEDIEAIKSDITGKSPEEAKDELIKLENQKVKFQGNNVYLSKAISFLRELKSSKQEHKKSIRQELDNYTEELFDEYESTINHFLQRFSANFKITNTEAYYRGDSPSSSYEIELLGKEIDPRMADEDEPSFETALSTGDKSTLAFAFFLAKIRKMDLGDKIVVFDDPVSSLDGHRKGQTKSEIKRISEKALQTIVMSHDPYFLKNIWDKIHKDDRKALRVYRSNDSSDIKEWDINKTTEESYFRDIENLYIFLEEGEDDEDQLRKIADSIRLVLEDYLKHRFPREFKPDDSLGDMVGKINRAEKGDKLESLQNYYADLDDLNEYSLRYHHATKRHVEEEPIDPNTLRSNVERTLSFIEGNLETPASN